MEDRKTEVQTDWRRIERIFLVGYMGAGKTTVGRMLDEKTDWNFIDMDDFLEKKYGMTIRNIFEEKGEKTFRQMERRCLKELLLKTHVVVATGGGVPCFDDNMRLIGQCAFCFYLKSSPEELARRLELSGVEKRPTLQNRSGRELVDFVEKTLSARSPFYEQADAIVEGSVEELFQKIAVIARLYTA
ncbi:MAG: AAA family ATPase [Prevotellaceae bacterium]|jgi:shikimate kinase|nr:AAA family ATPase [Prevotellaceae bacterium]